ncbi:hypothetical protein [Paenibacillus montanisoli]|uniref:Uncharacterized protein n=1 Tax=Paenibacillus montanisoli TaxID=2081970 RepID=A0A328TSB6_9BACL|nr:hypothetical protein [Paenibacillus montanisoli]RAP73368.1 hypothetical protein DL346_27040 [Paenibacillus montanisoli]
MAFLFPIGRIISDTSVVVRDSAEEAVQALLEGALGNAVETGMSSANWPTLVQFNTPNNGDFPSVGNPLYIWDSADNSNPGKRLGFAKAIDIPAGQDIPFVLHLFVFADNAVKARAQIFSKGATPTEQLDITDGFLLDNSFNLTSGSNKPPFEWQNVRYYSKAFQNNAQGQQVVVSFEVQNYIGGSFDPGALMFVADLYSPNTF